jgi:hypothetical protein
MARLRVFTGMWTGGSVRTGGTHGGRTEQVARENYYITDFLYCFNTTLLLSPLSPSLPLLSIREGVWVMSIAIVI